MTLHVEEEIAWADDIGPIRPTLLDLIRQGNKTLVAGKQTRKFQPFAEKYDAWIEDIQGFLTDAILKPNVATHFGEFEHFKLGTYVLDSSMIRDLVLETEAKVEDLHHLLSLYDENEAIVPWVDDEYDGDEYEDDGEDAGTESVFIVHGHDRSARESVARFVERLGLEAVVLMERPNQGKTIIEKFEANANVAFAVVLLTPDDLVEGGSGRRARQNVIFEMGYFTGHLGRDRVAALVAPDVDDIPSDLHGVAYIPLDASGGWQVALAKEFKEAGLTVDGARLLA